MLLFKTYLISMNLLVLLQVRSRAEFFVAITAGEGLLSRMYSLVANQIWDLKRGHKWFKSWFDRYNCWVHIVDFGSAFSLRFKIKDAKIVKYSTRILNSVETNQSINNEQLTWLKDWLQPCISHLKGLSLSWTRPCFWSDENCVKLWSH